MTLTKEYRDRLLGVDNKVSSNEIIQIEDQVMIEDVKKIVESNNMESISQEATTTERSMGNIAIDLFSNSSTNTTDNGDVHKIENKNVYHNEEETKQINQKATPQEQDVKHENPIFVAVKFNYKSDKQYYYLLGDTEHVNIGDKVIVYTSVPPRSYI